MNHAFENPAEFGGQNNYIPADLAIIDELMAESYDGAEACKFFPDWVRDLADGVYLEIGSPMISVSTGWGVFQTMIGRFEELVNARLEAN